MYSTPKKKKRTHQWQPKGDCIRKKNKIVQHIPFKMVHAVGMKEEVSKNIWKKTSSLDVVSYVCKKALPVFT